MGVKCTPKNIVSLLAVYQVMGINSLPRKWEKCHKVHQLSDVHQLSTMDALCSSR